MRFLIFPLSLIFIFHFSFAQSQASNSDSTWIDNIPVNVSFPPCSKKVLSSLDSSIVKSFISDAKKSESSALIVVFQGCTAIELHFGGKTDEVFSVQSITKSVASLAVGILVDKGFNLDTSIQALFPNEQSSFQKDPEKSKITVRNLISQTSGLGEWDKAAANSTSLVQNVLDSKLISAVGAQWNYSSMASYLLGPIIKNLTGIDSGEYIINQVLRPAGILSGIFSNQAEADLGGGLSMNSRDMLKLGNLMLKNGRANGNPIVSKNWVLESVQASQSFFPAYGWMWWLYSPEESSQSYSVYSAVGYQGQYVTVYPQASLIAVRTHRVENAQNTDRLNTIFWRDFPNLIQNLVKKSRK